MAGNNPVIQNSRKMNKIKIFRVGQRSDGLYYIICHKHLTTAFGDTIVTGFVATETAPLVAEGDEIDEPKGLKIDWKA